MSTIVLIGSAVFVGLWAAAVGDVIYSSMQARKATI